MVEQLDLRGITAWFSYLIRKTVALWNSIETEDFLQMQNPMACLGFRKGKQQKHHSYGATIAIILKMESIDNSRMLTGISWIVALLPFNHFYYTLHLNTDSEYNVSQNNSGKVAVV